jgi:hypothetical protein
MRRHASTSTSAPGAGRSAELGLPGKSTLVGALYPQGTSPPPTPASRPVLRLGATGPAVEDLQRALQIAPDGQFGPETHAAVIAFQRASGLACDGVVGPQTWGAIAGAAPADPSAAEAPAEPASEPAATIDPPAVPGAPAGTDAVPEPTSDAAGVRAAIVAAARGKIGTVLSDVAGPADETGDRTRTGWETLTEIFAVAHPTFPKHIIKYIKHGKNNGSKESSPNGLPSWCGIFATWAVITGGGTCGTWTSGDRCSSMKRLTRDPKPGDVGYFTAHQHHCIIASVHGDQIETIDGNSYDGGSGGNGAITSRMRSRGDFAGFFKQVDD